MDIRHTATTCPYCGCGCGLTLETAEGRIQRSVPTPDSPVNRGKLCVKGWNVHEFIQHPDRLKTPLLRTEQGWQSLDWESALDHAAGELARMGYDVTVFEAFHTAGGVLTYGIPEFRLPKAIVAREVSNLEKMGVDIELNMVIGKVLTIPELFERGYEAVFVASGAGLPMFMKIPGEGLVGVYSANEYLTRINLMKAYQEGAETPILHNKKVAVVGGGNVAMDAARCAKRLGAEVHIVYRRSEAELPARAEEVHHAKEEGIIFDLLTNPISIEGDEKGHVQSMTCIRMELGEPDASGRRRPVPMEGSEFKMEADAVIMALGTSPNPMSTKGTEGLEKTRKGCVAADENGQTSLPGVFAGGDAATGAATVILAMGAGKHAAKSIDAYIKSKG